MTDQPGQRSISGRPVRVTTHRAEIEARLALAQAGAA